MKAISLFSDANDAGFRLRKTYIRHGGQVYHVNEVEYIMPPPRLPFDALLRLGHQLEVFEKAEVSMRLSAMPLKSMFDFPVGYVDGAWVSRGVSRTRHQGITFDALWTRNINFHGFGQNLRKTLLKLNSQKSYRTNPLRYGQPITNRILISKDLYTFYEGLYIGDYIGPNKVKLYHTNPTYEILRALRKACLTVT